MKPGLLNQYMCMACNNGGKITKKKIVVLSAAASGIAAATYAAFTVTHNLAIATTFRSCHLK